MRSRQYEDEAARETLTWNLEQLRDDIHHVKKKNIYIYKKITESLENLRDTR